MTSKPHTRADGTPNVYIIIGAAGGIGSALVRRLAGTGARLVLAGRNEGALKDLAANVDGLDGKVVPTDATDFDAVGRLFDRAADWGGRVDGCVNLPGTITLKPAHLTSDREFDETIAINLRTAFAVVAAAGKRLRGGGSVVLMTTAAARLGLSNHDAIAAAKGGVIAPARSAAATYSTNNLRVNCVAPGLVDTPLARGITQNDPSLKASEAMHPLGRIGAPDDVAPAIEWLLSGEVAWVTGQIIGVDGGLATVRSKGTG